MVQDLNDQGVEDRILEADSLVAVAFYDYSSAPCVPFLPELDAAADALKGKVEFYRLEATENPSITEHLGVEAVPTLLVFRDGEEIARYEGPYSRHALCDRLTALLTGPRSA